MTASRSSLSKVSATASMTQMSPRGASEKESKRDRKMAIILSGSGDNKCCTKLSQASHRLVGLGPSISKKACKRSS
eukprot:11743158-Alexandrium_andersonii.AAC.1